MDKKNEILLAVREAKGNLGAGTDFRVMDALTILEGIAPFLDKEAIVAMKCKGCDNHASASFPLSNDFWVVDKNEYCHAKEVSIKNLATSKMASCMQYTTKARDELEKLATDIIEEDLRPAFRERKLYDRSQFASYNVAFRLQSAPGKVGIEFGHKNDKGFICSDIRLYILMRLDPEFGAEASLKIAQALKRGLVLVVKASAQTRRQIDIDYMLEWIAKKRKMDIVYL
jgi:hypothetical protein